MIHWLTLLWSRPRRMSRQQWRSLAHQLGAPQTPPLGDVTVERQAANAAFDRMREAGK